MADDLPELGDKAFDLTSIRAVASPSGGVSIPGLDDNVVRLTLEELRAQTLDGALFSADGKTLIAALEPKVDYVVPEGVETIGEDAFFMDDALRTITFSESVRKVERSAFYACDWLRMLLMKGRNDFQMVGSPFCACLGLNVVVSPDGDGCSILGWGTDLTFEELRAQTLDGVVFSADGRTLITCLEPKTEYKVPEGVEVIAESAFYNFETLESIEFPAGLREIRGGAFERCGKLTKLKFPKGLRKIEGEAFSGCGELKSVRFNQGLETLGFEAFSACRKLRSAKLPEGLQTLEYGAFEHCDRLSSVSFPSTLRQIGKNAFYRCGRLNVDKIELPANTVVEEGAFG